MFADDMNPFYKHKELKISYSLVNQELQKINEWFEVNKLSLNAGKTKHSLFHKASTKDDLPLFLSRLLIKKHKVDRVKLIKFLSVLLDGNFSWKDYIKYTENKVAKNFGLSSRAKLFLDENSLLTLYYSHLFKLCKFIVGQYKQNKSKKATQSTKARSTNYQQ